MIILDTNVISALMRPELNPEPTNWLDRHPARTIWISAVSLHENRAGILMLPEGKRKKALMAAFDQLLTDIVVDRILPFDRHAAEAAASLGATRVRAGRNVSFPDTQIAGIALAHRATLATRNTKDFADLAIPLVNPWEA